MPSFTRSQFLRLRARLEQIAALSDVVERLDSEKHRDEVRARWVPATASPQQIAAGVYPFLFGELAGEARIAADLARQELDILTGIETRQKTRWQRQGISGARPAGWRPRRETMKRCKDCGLYTVEPVNPVRRTPRRGRIKDPAYLSWCARQPCCLSGELPATTHHVRSMGSPKDDTRVIRLARRFHFHDAGPDSIERLGRRGFELMHGICIEAESKKLREKYDSELSARLPSGNLAPETGL